MIFVIDGIAEIRTRNKEQRARNKEQRIKTVKTKI
jgi:hypothetical protein